MATINKTIETVDRLRPNAYGPEDKFRWLSELDGMISRLVMQRPEPAAYEYPVDMDTELLAPAPFEEIYALYMMAMIDFHNREYGNYNNSMILFNEQFDAYKKAYIREHMPKQAGGYKHIWG